ncbi:recombinase family protein [Nocardioides piscis]|uniref:Recombinase family protein n=1 Tax=Nocardioides piscis TaxID=2714938 RepID=A0A6G7YDI4_9ACTN|nr:recombinase family protein [Nocardioides piscis]QIK74701.1 recombinase family protein [Nocardioides piscis]
MTTPDPRDEAAAAVSSRQLEHAPDRTPDGPERVRRAVIYARGPSLHAVKSQIDECRREAQRRAITVVAEASDVGALGDLSSSRPGWDRVASLIRADAVDLVMSTDITRITRRWVDMAVLLSLHRSHGIDFLSVSVKPKERPVDTCEGPVNRPHQSP